MARKLSKLQSGSKKREPIILKLICKEYTSKEIAKKVGLSAKRVDGIKNELMKRTKSKNVIGLVKYAIKNHIFTLKLNKQ